MLKERFNKGIFLPKLMYNPAKWITLLMIFLNMLTAAAQIRMHADLDAPSPHVLIQGQGCVVEYLEKDSIGPYNIIQVAQGERFLKLSYTDTNFYNDCIIRIGWKFSPGVYNGFDRKEMFLLRLSKNDVYQITRGVWLFWQDSLKGGYEGSQITVVHDSIKMLKSGRSLFNSNLLFNPNSTVDSVELIYRFNRFDNKDPFVFYLDDVQLELFRTAGVEEARTNNLNVYPNPCKDRLNIHSENIWNKAGLYDLNGRLLKSFQPDDAAPDGGLDVSELPAGMFVLQLQLPDGTQARARVVKGR